MIKKIKLYLVLSLILSQFNSAYSQIQIGDTAVGFNMISGAFGLQLPAHHMSEKFGMSATIGGLYNYKTKNNFIYGLEYNFLFGENIKNDSLFKNISTSDGNVIDGNGAFADIRTFERGFYTGLNFGKVFTIQEKNQNSGVFFMLSTGLLQHKIRIENPENAAYQITGDYAKGYDQLSNGLVIKEFIGYMHFGQHNPINFYAGFEFYQAWTQSRRDYDFNLMGKDDNTYFDSLWGIKIGWIFPLTGSGGNSYDKEYFYQ